MQQALRVGKRVHAETGIDRAGQSVVSAALAARLPGRRRPAGAALVIGAGSMGALAPGHADPRRRRTAARWPTAAPTGPPGWPQLHGATAGPTSPTCRPTLATVDIVVCATASPEPVLDRDLVGAALAGRAGRPLVILDLAVPRDVDGRGRRRCPGSP